MGVALVDAAGRPETPRPAARRSRRVSVAVAWDGDEAAAGGLGIVAAGGRAKEILAAARARTTEISVVFIRTPKVYQEGVSEGTPRKENPDARVQPGDEGQRG